MAHGVTVYSRPAQVKADTQPLLTGLLVVLLAVVVINATVSRKLTGSPDTAFGAIKDVIAAFLLGYAISMGRVRRSGLGPLVAAFLAVGMIGVIHTWVLRQGLYGWRNDFYPAVLIAALPGLLNRRSIRTIRVVLAWGLQAATLYGIYAWHLGLDYMHQVGLWPPKNAESFPFQFFAANSLKPRAFAPFVGPNEAGVSVSMILALLWCTDTWSIRTRVLISILPVTFVFLTHSRSSIIGLVVALVSILYWYFRKSGFGALITLASLGAGMVYASGYFATAAQSDPSIHGHQASFSNGVSLLISHPFGTGVGTVGPRAASNTVHYLVESNWLLLGIEGGVIALAIYLAILFRIALTGWRSRESLRCFSPVVVLGAALVSQIVLPTMQDGTVAFLFWCLLAIGLAECRLDRESDGTSLYQRRKRGAKIWTNSQLRLGDSAPS